MLLLKVLELVFSKWNRGEIKLMKKSNRMKNLTYENVIFAMETK